MKDKPSAKQQRGVGLIEVLISLLLLSLCLLGMAALQASTLRNNQSAQSRSMATIMTASITESMRANVTAARGGEYNMSLCGDPSVETMAADDLIAWTGALRRAIGNTACGGISCTGRQCDVTVQWDDSRATAGASSHSITTRVQL